MSQVFKRGAAKSEINMTPLIDITFQLIIFFLLTNNIASQEAVEMVVPRLEDAKTQELGEVPRVVVNVVPTVRPTGSEDNPLNHAGDANFVRVGQQDFRFEDTAGVTAALADALARHKARGNKEELEVLLRADGALYYDSVLPVMNAITAAGIAKVNLVAFLPDKPQ